MKKYLSTIILSVITSFVLIGQSPLYFPDGIIVGSPTLTLPSTSGAYKMAVEGGIITEKVRVATTGSIFWADFVFDKNYKLKSLPQLERYIKLNKHLPGIPTTAEVQKEGFDLGYNQALLLQKIEELTLYTIEQNKKIETLTKKVEALSKRK